MLKVNEKIQIPLTEFQFTFARGSGPGGQNVNKVNTKVTLRWPIDKSRSLSETIKKRIAAKHAKKINQDGEMLIFSHRFRDQGRNVADCLDKLREIISEAAKPVKKRIATKTPRKAKKRRLADKKLQSAKKELRKPPKNMD